MNRRESLKAIVLGTVSSAFLLESCGDTKTEEQAAQVLETPAESAPLPGRMPEEIAHLKEITSKTFFTEPEMATITVLADIIIPADDVSGSASEAGVPDFIEFIVKDKPENQTPMRAESVMRLASARLSSAVRPTWSTSSRRRPAGVVSSAAARAAMRPPWWPPSSGRR